MSASQAFIGNSVIEVAKCGVVFVFPVLDNMDGAAWPIELIAPEYPSAHLR